MSLNKNLKKIISDTDANPTIVNEASNFVVCTYWWGRGNKNNNTSRPCVSFYEEIINIAKQQSIALLENLMQRNLPIKEVYAKLEHTIIEDKTVLSMIAKKIKKYTNELNIANTTLSEKMGDRIQANVERQSTLFFEVMRIILLYLIISKPLLLQYAHIKHKADILKQQYADVKDMGSHKIKLELKELISEKNRITAELSKVMNAENEYMNDISSYSIPAQKMYSVYKKTELPADIVPDAEISFWTKEELAEIQKKSILKLLTERFVYILPLTYDEMITEWENACRRAGCNYMAIEYPDFAKKGGYQMAINAKPMFIKKALELCGNRNILYIDGDMTINKYPHIFDMPDVDYMARGWWVDPRASYRMNESIMYDPYLFETSGGTMFFSQSIESKRLIDKWIEESDKPQNAGKADDRIISLIFNTNRLLLNMKIMQLPIEYLWLTLDYDDRMLVDADWDMDELNRIREGIYIEHPECLTSEDTAAGAGASSNRTPKFYSAINEEKSIEPISEIIHENVLFPSAEMAESFADYFRYMKSATYLDDGNEVLYTKHFVDKENPENNESPVYVIPYAEQFGNKKEDYGDGEFYSPNEIVSVNMKASREIQLESFPIFNIEGNNVELRNKKGMADKDIIRAIIRLLTEGKNVYYNPYNAPDIYYQQLLMPRYSNMDFVFSPDIVGFDFHAMYRPKIHTNLPMFFKSGSNTLIQLLSMFISFEDLSNYFYNGTYEFLSKLRIGYLMKPKMPKCAKKKNKTCVVSGGDGEQDFDTFIHNYNDTLDFFYSGGKSKRKTRKRKTKRKMTYKTSRK